MNAKRIWMKTVPLILSLGLNPGSSIGEHKGKGSEISINVPRQFFY